MIRILFICHGNICRSPMAEFVMKKLVAEEGLASGFRIASAATSSEELGNPVYPPARKVLAGHGISCEGKTARRVSADEYSEWDLFVCADEANLRALRRLFGGDPEHRISKLLDHVPGGGGDVADPWYTGDFETAMNDVSRGCRGLLQSIRQARG